MQFIEKKTKKKKKKHTHTYKTQTFTIIIIWNKKYVRMVERLKVSRARVVRKLRFLFFLLFFFVVVVVFLQTTRSPTFSRNPAGFYQ